MRELAKSNLDKEAYKAIKIPEVITDAKTAGKIFKQLKVNPEKVDFTKYVVFVAAEDQNDPNARGEWINPVYSKDGKRLMLSPMDRTLIGFQPSDRYKFAVYKVAKGITTGFSKRVFKDGKIQMEDVVNW